MENTNNIYIVKPIGFHEMEEIIAIFDSREKAENFIDRFKTRPIDLEIVEAPLNPEYIANKQADPYTVTLRENTNDPINLGINDLIEMAEAAAREEYDIFFYDGAERSQGVFNIMLFSGTEQEALSRAIEKRDETVASGEWDKEYQHSIEIKSTMQHPDHDK
ncbi:hypothetical protein H9X96_20680 [Pedobacter sp. N36a]|uniref:hypothetical protein n=1 Tax=Pedobacter sp. N36a TaxID=2767996 RepID=UPI001656AB19|nr:hypothetical protein [Pedobacter sp. N36a]MBC8988177.1 hypothetical protein [Pedobacter sp. N36a]